MTDADAEADPLVALAEEFAERRRRGERPSLTEYTRQHPDQAERIRRLFPALAALEELGSIDGPGAGHLASTPEGLGPVPTHLGDFRLLREVGRGGMGVVYEAEQVSLGRRVALKVLPRSMVRDATQRLRFEREARAAARLHHTNIVPVFGVGEQDGHHYYVMQFIGGQALDAVLDELRRLRQAHPGPGAPGVGPRDPGPGPGAGRIVPDVSAAAVACSLVSGDFLMAGAPGGVAAETEAQTPEADATGPREAAGPPARGPAGSADLSGLSQSDRVFYTGVARIGRQVAEALEYANRQGILHRDVKPSNLLLDAAGNVWVTDFGLAKAADADDLTHTGDLLGTIRYMAPERFRGRCDARSDVYSLGLTLYELVALRPAFEASDRDGLIDQVSHREPPRLKALAPTVPRDLETIIAKATAREPERRYASAAALGEDLRRFVDREPIKARSVGPLERARIWARRRPAVAGLLGLVALCSATGLAGVLWQWREATRQRNQALAARDLAQLRLAHLAYERGQTACEEGEIGPGLLRLIQCWRSAADAADPDWQHAARANLAAWLRLFPAPEAIFPGDGGFPRQSLAVSPDGRTILIGSLDGTARLLDATTLTPIGKPMTHARRTTVRVAFSPDGTMALTGSYDRTARLWDVATQEPLGAPLEHDGEVLVVAFSPDGRTILTGSLDGKARLWEVGTGALINELPHRERVVAVAFSTDGTLALTGSFDGTARLWDARTGEPLGDPLPHDAQVSAVAFSPDGKTILTGTMGADGKARRWDVATRDQVGEAMPHKLGISQVAFSPDGRTALTGSFDGTVSLWDAQTGEPLGMPLPHDGQIFAVAFSPDSQTVLIGSGDGKGRLWDVPTGEPLGMPLIHEGPIRVVAFIGDGRAVLTGGDDQKFRRWDLSRIRSPVSTPLWQGDRVRAAAFTPDGQAVLTGSDTGRVQLRDLATGRRIGPEIRSEEPISSVAIRPDGKTILTVGTNSGAQLWDFGTGQRIGAPLVHRKFINGGAFTPDGRTALTWSPDGTVRFWGAADGRPDGGPLPLGASWIYCVAFSPDGRIVATGSDDRAARLWDVATRRRIGSGMWHETPVTLVAFSPDGERLLTTGPDRWVRLWDVASGRAIGRPLRTRSQTQSVAFSPDGTMILTQSINGTAQLWDVATGQCLGAPLEPEGLIRAATFRPDGQAILTMGTDGTVRLWPVAELPDDLPGTATRVEALTGLTLDASGAIQPLDNAAWLQRREASMRAGRGMTTEE